MILGGGIYKGTRILSPMAVATMTGPHAVSPDGATRGLGWDIATSFSTNKGDLFPLGSFGHTGFTGTSLWIDPASDTFIVFLSNRVHPDGKGDVGPLRGRVASIVAGLATDTTVTKARAEAAHAAAELLGSVARPDPKAGAANTSRHRDAEAQVFNARIGHEPHGFHQV